jgi:hypothetical protein
MNVEELAATVNLFYQQRGVKQAFHLMGKPYTMQATPLVLPRFFPPFVNLSYSSARQ